MGTTQTRHAGCSGNDGHPPRGTGLPLICWIMHLATYDREQDFTRQEAGDAWVTEVPGRTRCRAAHTDSCAVAEPHSATVCDCVAGGKAGNPLYKALHYTTVCHQRCVSALPAKGLRHL